MLSVATIATTIMIFITASTNQRDYLHAFDYSTNAELVAAMNDHAKAPISYAGEVVSTETSNGTMNITLDGVGELKGRTIVVRSGMIRETICKYDRINGMGKLISSDLNGAVEATIDGNSMTVVPYVAESYNQRAAGLLIRNLFGRCDS